MPTRITSASSSPTIYTKRCYCEKRAGDSSRRASLGVRGVPVEAELKPPVGRGLTS
ncbi:MAG: hypothetical protein ACO2OR_03685 [Desulfurococcaceae archaeon]